MSGFMEGSIEVKGGCWNYVYRMSLLQSHMNELQLVVYHSQTSHMKLVEVVGERGLWYNNGTIYD